jgi:hypothetical protein
MINAFLNKDLSFEAKVGDLNLPVKISSVFRQDSVVACMRYNFSTLDGGTAQWQAFAHRIRAPDLISSPAQIEVN